MGLQGGNRERGSVVALVLGVRASRPPIAGREVVFEGNAAAGKGNFEYSSAFMQANPSLE